MRLKHGAGPLTCAAAAGQNAVDLIAVSAIGGIRQQCPAGPDGDMLLLFSQTCINNPETALVVYDRDPSCLIPRFDGAI